jgi:hypothetical protein
MDEWSVLIEAIAPEGVRPISIDGPRFEALSGALDAFDAATTINEQGGWLVHMVINADGIFDAIAIAKDVVGPATIAAGIPDWPIVAVEATEWNVVIVKLAAMSREVAGMTQPHLGRTV